MWVVGVGRGMGRGCGPRGGWAWANELREEEGRRGHGERRSKDDPATQHSSAADLTPYGCHTSTNTTPPAALLVPPSPQHADAGNIVSTPRHSA